MKDLLPPLMAVYFAIFTIAGAGYLITQRAHAPSAAPSARTDLTHSPQATTAPSRVVPPLPPAKPVVDVLVSSAGCDPDIALDQTLVTTDDLRRLAKLGCIETIRMVAADVSQADLSALSTLPKLRKLDLDISNVSDAQ